MLNFDRLAKPRCEDRQATIWRQDEALWKLFGLRRIPFFDEYWDGVARSYRTYTLPEMAEVLLKRRLVDNLDAAVREAEGLIENGVSRLCDHAKFEELVCYAKPPKYRLILYEAYRH